MLALIAVIRVELATRLGVGGGGRGHGCGAGGGGMGTNEASTKPAADVNSSRKRPLLACTIYY